MTAKTIYAIHTGPVLVDVIRSLAKELMPEVRVVNVVDDGLLAEVREAGELTTAVSRRLVGYGVIAAASGADAILNCCSSVGEAAELLQKVVEVPVVRIDDAMARQAAKLGPRIAVVATLATTLEPTRRLIARRANEERHDVKLTSYVAGEAFDSLLAGNGAKHDELVNEVIDRAMRELADRRFDHPVALILNAQRAIKISHQQTRACPELPHLVTQITGQRQRGGDGSDP